MPRVSWSGVLALAAALTLGGINEAGYRQSSHALAEIDQAEKVRLLLGSLMQGILEAETGQRGYLLTGSARYRGPYDVATHEISAHLDALRALYAGRPEESARLEILAGHVADKLAEMDMSVRMRESGNDDAWKFVLTTDVGHKEMAVIRQSLDALEALGNRTLVQRQAQITRTLLMERVGIAIALVVVLLAFWRFLAQTRQLRLAGERQQRALEHERSALESQVRERTASLTELATHLQEVRESERGHLARELHDELGSLLTAAKLDVARLRSLVVDKPGGAQRLQHLIELLNSGIALKRRIIEDLRPSSLANLGLVASLEILTREFGERSGIHVSLALEPVTLNEADQLTVYRMVQEGLTNIGKYAQASEVTIMLRNCGNHVTIEVADNGKGFDPWRTQPSTHGLAGMRHRVEAAHGKLSIKSAPGQGTVLSALLPAHTD